MDAEAVRRRVEELGPWFHQIDLGDGIRTRDIAPTPGPQPQDHPRRRWRLLEPVLPEDLSGERILDVGAADGFFSIELARRGAAEVVAVEFARKRYEALTWAVEHLGLGNVTPVRGDVYELDRLVDGAFDRTLMLALLYHLKDPLRGLELVAARSPVLYLETPVIRDDRPYLYLEPPLADVHAARPKWIPTDRCVRDLLTYVGYASVDEVTEPPEHARATSRDRPIFVARATGA